VTLHRSGCTSDFYIQHNEANFVGVEAGIEVVERRFLAGGVLRAKGDGKLEILSNFAAKQVMWMRLLQ
jgi:hypothetical protein